MDRISESQNQQHHREVRFQADDDNVETEDLTMTSTEDHDEMTPLKPDNQNSRRGDPATGETEKNYLRFHSGGSLSSNSYPGHDHHDQEMQPWRSSRQARAALLSVISSLYALVLVITALAFEVSTFVADERESARYDPFYIYLYLVGLVFFAYCYFFLLRTEGWNVPVPFYRRNTSNKSESSGDDLHASVIKSSLPAFMSAKRKVTHSGNNAGSLYLRLGAIVFGIVGMIDKALTMYSAVDSGHVPDCYGGVNIFEDILAVIFIFVQLYFIFQNSKMTIHRFKEIGRLGSMHLIATNLCLWIRAVVTEEYHIIKEIEEKRTHREAPKQIVNVTVRKFIVDHTTGMGHMIVTAMSTNRTSPSSALADCGHVQKELEGVIRSAKPFMTTCIIEYSLICAAVMYIMWRNVGKTALKRTKYRKHNFQIDCSSSTRGLFVGLLFVVLTIISMIIFFTKVELEKDNEALWVFYVSDCVLYVVSIFALSVGMFRIRTLYYAVHVTNKGVLLDDILLIVALVGQLMFCIFSIVALSNIDLTAAMVVVVSILRMIEVLLQTVFILIAQHLVALTPEMQAVKPGRELITFLLLSNLAMFLINMFETQKAGSNELSIKFYGESIWTVIVHSTVPLNIFYRFHSSVCFAEIWKSTYRVKEPETL